MVEIKIDKGEKKYKLETEIVFIINDMFTTGPIKSIDINEQIDLMYFFNKAYLGHMKISDFKNKLKYYFTSSDTNRKFYKIQL